MTLYRNTRFITLAVMTGLAFSASQAQADCDAKTALDAAASTLSAAKKAGGEWRLIDKSTGSASQAISKLLKIAKKKLAAGEAAEACRIADKVAWAADMGLAQSRAQANAAPTY